MDKWQETLIIQNHWFCSLACRTCRPDMEPVPDVGEFHGQLPQLITTEELGAMIGHLKTNRLLGKDRISEIRFAGEWSEPTLDETLPEKIDLLVKETKDLGCLIGVITNGVNLPHGSYDEEKMEKYFINHFGFIHFPKNVELFVSVGDEHLLSYLEKRQKEGADAKVAEVEYREKVANLFTFMRQNGNWGNLNINVVAPINAPPDFLDKIRQKFAIPEDYVFKYGTLRLANYSPHQEKMKGAVDLTLSDEPPNNIERTYFIGKERGKLLLYTSISKFCYKIGGVPYQDYSFPILNKT